MRMEPKRVCLFISIAVVLIVLNTNIERADCAEMKKRSSWWCNGTIADCIEEDDQEFPMESEVSRRILQSNNQLRARNSLQKGSAVCDTAQYGDCIPRQINDRNRPCTYENRCKRGPPP
ncbi:unnamed protein product [Ilex paraguariensis]|uniref:Uncharacterized protein n=1 Tax=Ilex paraguariensis TaxID=185542 RepID=A0ABC8SMI2_9AQUA